MNNKNIVMLATVSTGVCILLYAIKRIFEREEDYNMKKIQLCFNCDDAKLQIDAFEVPYYERKLKDGMMHISKSAFIDWFDVVHNNLIDTIDKFLYRVETKSKIDAGCLRKSLTYNVTLYKNARIIFERYMQYEKSKVTTLTMYVPLSLAELVCSYMTHSYNLDVDDFIYKNRIIRRKSK